MSQRRESSSYKPSRSRRRLSNAPFRAPAKVKPQRPKVAPFLQESLSMSNGHSNAFNFTFPSSNSPSKHWWSSSKDLSPSSNSISPQKQENHISSLQKLNALKYKDITFKVGKQSVEIPANRLMCARISPVWDAALYSNESFELKEIVVNDVESIDAFRHVINYSFCLPIHLKVTNVLQIYAIAEKYLIQDLMDECMTFLGNHVTSQHFCYLWNHCVTHHLGKCIELCQKKLAQMNVMQHIFATDAFKELTIEAMSLLIRSDQLKVKEEVLWTHLCHWARYQSKFSSFSFSDDTHKEEKKEEELFFTWPGASKAKESETETQALGDEAKQLLMPLKQYIRFPLMEVNYLVESVFPLGILSKDEQLELLILMVSSGGEQKKEKKEDIGLNDALKGLEKAIADIMGGTPLPRWGTWLEEQ